jgi:hypothetical protein
MGAPGLLLTLQRYLQATPRCIALWRATEARHHTRSITMANKPVWTYRNDIDTSASFVGYDVEAADGSIGKIDDASTDVSRRYVVVDTGFWIFGKKRLIPAGMVTTVDRTDHKVYVSMTKDQIKNAPDYDEAMTRDDEAYYDKYGTYYSSYWS